MIVVLLWIMVVFIMGSVQVCVGRVALTLNVIMTVTLNTWKTYQRGGLLSRPNCKNEKIKTTSIKGRLFSFLQL